MPAHASTSKNHPETGPKDVKIAVLLSTYNGEQYIEELLDSLLHKEFESRDLWVRDDGSHDNTVSLIRKFKKRLEDTDRRNRIFFIQGENIGVTSSFFTLADAAESGYDGFAFCDQDDVWHPDKLTRAASALSTHRASTQKNQSSREDLTNAEGPFLYHCRQWMTLADDPSVRELSPLPKRTGFGNALVQNQVVGCSMVINAELRKLMTMAFSRYGNNVSEHIIMHDWWCYLVASAFGDIYYDSHPSITFRRHDRSSSPATTGILQQMSRRAIALQKRSWSVKHILDQAASFQQVYGNALSNPKKKDLLNMAVKLRKSGLFFRTGYFFSGRHYRSTRFETLVFRLLVVAGH